MKIREWNKAGKRLDLEKVCKMLDAFLAGKLDLPLEAFETLKKVIMSLQEQEEKMAYVPPTPTALPTTIQLLKPSGEHKPKPKNDPNMTKCIEEMRNNKLFLKMKDLSEIEIKIKIPEQIITATATIIFPQLEDLNFNK